MATTGVWLVAKTREVKLRDGLLKGGHADPKGETKMLYVGHKPVWFRNLPPDRFNNCRDVERRPGKAPGKKELDAQDAEQDARRKLEAEEKQERRRRSVAGKPRQAQPSKPDPKTDDVDDDLDDELDAQSDEPAGDVGDFDDDDDDKGSDPTGEIE